VQNPALRKNFLQGEPSKLTRPNDDLLGQLADLDIYADTEESLLYLPLLKALSNLLGGVGVGVGRYREQTGQVLYGWWEGYSILPRILPLTNSFTQRAAEEGRLYTWEDGRDPLTQQYPGCKTYAVCPINHKTTCTGFLFILSPRSLTLTSEHIHALCLVAQALGHRWAWLEREAEHTQALQQIQAQAAELLKKVQQQWDLFNQELRAPMTNIKLALRLLQDLLPQDSNYLRVLTVECDRQNLLMKSLATPRPSTQNPTSTLQEPVEFGQLLQSLRQEFLPQARARGAILELTPANFDTFHSNPELIRTLLQELVALGLATMTPGTIRLVTTGNPPWLYFNLSYPAPSTTLPNVDRLQGIVSQLGGQVYNHTKNDMVKISVMILLINFL